MESFRLDNKVAVVTGGGQGLGAAMAKALAEAGAHIVIADLNPQTAAETATQMKKISGKSAAIQTDVGQEDQVKAMVKQTVDEFGTIDILINSAGLNRRYQLIDLPTEEFDTIMNINLRGTFICCREAAKVMMNNNGGSIINISSMSSFIINQRRPVSAYCASKAGVNLLTKGMAAEWAEFGIRVNAIAPGYFKTPLNAPWMSTEQGPEALKSTPLNRFAEPAEIGAAALYLASPGSSFVTGHILSVDGGYTIW